MAPEKPAHDNTTRLPAVPDGRATPPGPGSGSPEGFGGSALPPVPPAPVFVVPPSPVVMVIPSLLLMELAPPTPTVLVIEPCAVDAGSPVVVGPALVDWLPSVEELAPLVTVTDDACVVELLVAVMSAVVPAVSDPLWVDPLTEWLEFDEQPNNRGASAMQSESLTGVAARQDRPTRGKEGKSVMARRMKRGKDA